MQGVAGSNPAASTKQTQGLFASLAARGRATVPNFVPHRPQSLRLEAAVAADGRLGDVDPEHQQLGANARRSPRGFSRLIRRIRSLISPLILGRPPRRRHFQRQYAWNPRRCQRITVSGLMIVIAFRIDGKSRYSHTKSRRSVFRSPARTGDLRRKTMSCWRRTMLSASSLTRDLNRAHKMSRSRVNNATTARSGSTPPRPRHSGRGFR